MSLWVLMLSPYFLAQQGVSGPGTRVWLESIPLSLLLFQIANLLGKEASLAPLAFHVSLVGQGGSISGGELQVEKHFKESNTSKNLLCIFALPVVGPCQYFGHCCSGH